MLSKNVIRGSDCIVARKKRNNYAIDVFINCPFDRRYKSLFDAIVFSVFFCGFRARCTLEMEGGTPERLRKIYKIISECKYGLHDISRTSLDSNTKLPRFNMPFELGVFLAAKHFGIRTQKQKECLIVDTEQYRYQKFISDIAGLEVQAHNRDEKCIIKVVCNWLYGTSQKNFMPDGSEVYRRYQCFLKDLPKICKAMGKQANKLSFNNYASIVSEWIKHTEWFRHQ